MFGRRTCGLGRGGRVPPGAGELSFGSDPSDATTTEPCDCDRLAAAVPPSTAGSVAIPAPNASTAATSHHRRVTFRQAELLKRPRALPRFVGPDVRSGSTVRE